MNKPKILHQLLSHEICQTVPKDGLTLLFMQMMDFGETYLIGLKSINCNNDNEDTAGKSRC